MVVEIAVASGCNLRAPGRRIKETAKHASDARGHFASVARLHTMLQTRNLVVIEMIWRRHGACREDSFEYEKDKRTVCFGIPLDSPFVDVFLCPRTLQANTPETGSAAQRV